MLWLILLVVAVALVFEYINGFHDAANAIATVVSTRVLAPRQAIVLAGVANMVGAFFGDNVAKMIHSGLIVDQYVTVYTVLCALIAGIVWNLITWWFGLPSSSSHALIGGLIGAGIASAGGKLSAVKWWWMQNDPSAGMQYKGVLPKVVVPMITSPILGIIIGFIFMLILLLLVHRMRPVWVNAIFGKLQIGSAAFMGFSHGSNDATKTMGIITLSLYVASHDGTFAHLPSWLGFLNVADKELPIWVKVVCALTITAGTMAGGWRIIRTMGHKIVRLQPIHGFAAETTAASIIHCASHYGIPISTTHVISTSIMGVGATKRFSAVKWGIVGRIVWAWVLTLPITGLIGFGLQGMLKLWIK